MFTLVGNFGYLEEPLTIRENAMNENEIVEISLLLSKAHLHLLEDLADSKNCSLGEAVRLLLKQSNKLK